LHIVAFSLNGGHFHCYEATNGISETLYAYKQIKHKYFSKNTQRKLLKKREGVGLWMSVVIAWG